MKTNPPPWPTLTVAFWLPGAGVAVGFAAGVAVGLPPGAGVAVRAPGTGVGVGFNPVMVLSLLWHVTAAAITTIGASSATQRRRARFSFIRAPRFLGR